MPRRSRRSAPATTSLTCRDWPCASTNGTSPGCACSSMPSTNARGPEAGPRRSAGVGQRAGFRKRLLSHERAASTISSLSTTGSPRYFFWLEVGMSDFGVLNASYFVVEEPEHLGAERLLDGDGAAREDCCLQFRPTLAARDEK